MALLIGNTVLSYRNILTIIENEQWVSHTHEVLTELEAVLSTLKDAETGQRGYLLTGQEPYLEPYQSAISEVYRSVDRLQASTADNPLQQQRIQVLRQKIKQKLAELENTITTRRRLGVAAATALVQTDRGKQLMDEIREQIAVMQTTEHSLLQQRQHESRMSIQQTVFSLLMAAGLILLLIGLVAYLIERDRRQRQRDEAALRESDARLRAILDSSPAVIYTKDLHGCFLFINREFESLFGLTRSQVVGKTDYDFFPKAIADATTQNDRRVVSTGKVLHSEEVIPHPDGQRTYVSVKFPLRLADGQIYAVCGILTDITDRQLAEVALKELNETLEQRVEERTAQLLDSNRELEAFTYSVSHDLRAPLRTIQGFAQVLQEDYGADLDEFGQSYVRSIIEDTVQMNGLIADLLAYSRLSRTQLTLHPVELGDVIGEAQKQLIALINQQQADIQVTTPLPAVSAHRQTLTQVLVNLLENAVKFTKVGIPPRVEIYAEPAPNRPTWTRLWVVDQGIGIAPDHQERIFRVFERLHSAETYPGTGIGLAIVRRGIERMHGRVGVESQLEQGSRFWIELPSAPATI